LKFFSSNRVYAMDFVLLEVEQEEYRNMMIPLWSSSPCWLWNSLICICPCWIRLSYCIQETYFLRQHYTQCIF